MEDENAEFVDLDAPQVPADEQKQPDANVEQDANAAPADEGQNEDNADHHEGDKPDPSDGNEGDEDEAPKRKRPSGAERLRRRLERERSERERLERELATMRSGSETKPVAEGEDEAVRAIIGDPPREDQFSEYFAYERAMTAYEVDKRQATRAIREQSLRQESDRRAQAEDQFEDFRERIAETKKHIPDYDEVLSASNVQIASHVGQLIIDNEKGPQVAYHLAKNPDLVERLNSMSETRAAMEIGRLESRLSLPKPKTVTNAPPPMETPRGGSSPSRSPDQMPMDDFAKWLVKRVG